MSIGRTWLRSAGLAEYGVLALTTLFLAAQLHPALWFRTSAVSGGDLGAHVWTTKYLHDHLSAGLWGWSPDWFAGFVPFNGEFPGGFLLIAALGHVLPLGVAFRLVIVFSMLLLPWSAWAFGRLARLRAPLPQLLAVATVPFLLDRFQVAEGGNMLSTLVGEFEYSLALCATLVFLGLVVRGLETGRGRGWAAVALAVVLLCHLVVAIFALLGAVAILVLSPRGRRQITWFATAVGTALLLSGAFLVPFLWRLGYATDEGQNPKLRAYGSALFPFGGGCPDPPAYRSGPVWLPHFAHTCGAERYYTAQTIHLLPVALLAATAVIFAYVGRRRVVLALVLAALGVAALFVAMPQGSFWNGRLLPCWYLCLYLLAAVGLAELVTRLQTALRPRPAPPTRGRRSPKRSAPSRSGPAWLAPATPLATLVVVVLALGIPVGAVAGTAGNDPREAPSVLPNLATYALSGFPGQAGWPEYRGVIDTMATIGRTHGCGRAYADLGGHDSLARYGSQWAMFLLPYWTNGCITSLGGLYFEASATSPYVDLVNSELSFLELNPKHELPYQPFSVETGARHLRYLGVEYYLALDPQAKAAAAADPDLALLAMSGPWNIYRVRGAALVEGLAEKPVVLRGLGGQRDWLAAGITAYLAAGSAASHGPVYVASGPSGWPSVTVAHRSVPRSTVEARLAIPEAAPAALPSTVVSSVRQHGGHISFDVSRVGTPVLVRESYYPNWQAHGADGPWRASPNFMVVVPTSRHVELTFDRAAPETVGEATSLAGLVALAALTGLGYRRRRLTAASLEPQG